MWQMFISGHITLQDSVLVFDDLVDDCSSNNALHISIISDCDCDYAFYDFYTLLVFKCFYVSVL